MPNGLLTAGVAVIDGGRALLTGERPDTSIIGIVLTGLSLVVMPWLARAQRRVGLATDSRLVLAEAAETKLWGWLSVSTFASLLVYALLGWTWLDPAAAVFALKEGREAWQGDLVCDDED